MTERECIRALLPLAEGFVKEVMRRDPTRYPPESLPLAMAYLVEARRLLGWPTMEGVDEAR